MEANGFRVEEEVALTDFPAAPASWTRRESAVDEWIESHHADDPRLTEAQEQQSKIGHLIGSGVVTGVVIHAVAD